MKTSCISPQIINYLEFDEYWLKILDKLENLCSINKGKQFNNEYEITIHIRGEII